MTTLIDPLATLTDAHLCVKTSLALVEEVLNRSTRTSLGRRLAHDSMQMVVEITGQTEATLGMFDSPTRRTYRLNEAIDDIQEILDGAALTKAKTGSFPYTATFRRLEPTLAAALGRIEQAIEGIERHRKEPTHA